ncbi:hypothetical protein AB5J62_05590 [Amycolatopsis sp. cg5]|uniref:hypothetical protein n=1 Tax=Amycolatopsis sp. cg5 TaxID=3238802 RepID=UPI0035265A1A
MYELVADLLIETVFGAAVPKMTHELLAEFDGGHCRMCARSAASAGRCGCGDFDGVVRGDAVAKMWIHWRSGSGMAPGR